MPIPSSGSIAAGSTIGRRSLYWPIAQEKQSFPKLLTWWVGENTQRRHVWPGLATYRLSPKEIVAQIELTRKLVDPPGHVHFSMKSIMSNKNGIADALKAVYKEKAAVPASPWLRERPR